MQNTEIIRNRIDPSQNSSFSQIKFFDLIYFGRKSFAADFARFGFFLHEGEKAFVLLHELLIDRGNFSPCIKQSDNRHIARPHVNSHKTMVGTE